MLGTILLIILLLLLLGGLPAWGPTPAGWHGYGYYPVGGIGIVLVIVLLLVLFGRL